MIKPKMYEVSNSIGITLDVYHYPEKRQDNKNKWFIVEQGTDHITITLEAARGIVDAIEALTYGEAPYVTKGEA